MFGVAVDNVRVWLDLEISRAQPFLNAFPLSCGSRMQGMTSSVPFSQKVKVIPVERR